MAYGLSAHDCQAGRIERLMPANANCVTLLIDSAEGELSINLFDLPDNAVAGLVAAFGSPRHVDLSPALDLLTDAAQVNIQAALEQATRPFIAAARCLKTVSQQAAE